MNSVTPGLICETCSKFVGVCRCEGKCPKCGKDRAECGGCQKKKRPVKRDGLEYGDFCGECGAREEDCTCWAGTLNDLIDLYHSMLKGRRKTGLRYKTLRAMLLKRIYALIEALSPSERSDLDFSPDNADKNWRI